MFHERVASVAQGSSWRATCFGNRVLYRYLPFHCNREFKAMGRDTEVMRFKGAKSLCCLSKDILGGNGALYTTDWCSAADSTPYREMPLSGPALRATADAPSVGRLATPVTAQSCDNPRDPGSTL